MIKCCYMNILETSTVSLAAGAEDPDYPLFRLYDRNIGRPFKTASAVKTEIKIGAAGPVLSVDRLLIPAGHNLAGMTLDLECSDDDITYIPVVPQWTGAPGLIDKSWTSSAHRYYKFVISSPASTPQITELFLSQTYDWQRDPSRPAGPFEPFFNVESETTSGGQDRFLVHGGPRRRRRYHMAGCGEEQKNDMAALYEAWAGAKPFYLQDYEGNWIFGRLKAPLDMKETAYQKYSFTFDFIEVLP